VTFSIEVTRILNWLRRQANAERNIERRKAFFEAYNAALQIATEVQNRDNDGEKK
jgi:hypothetical protein